MDQETRIEELIYSIGDNKSRKYVEIHECGIQNLLYKNKKSVIIVYGDYTGTGLKINKGKISYKGLARIVVSENVKEIINSTRKGVKKLKEEGYDIILLPPVLD